MWFQSLLCSFFFFDNEEPFMFNLVIVVEVRLNLSSNSLLNFVCDQIHNCIM